MNILVLSFFMIQYANLGVYSSKFNEISDCRFYTGDSEEKSYDDLEDIKKLTVVFVCAEYEKDIFSEDIAVLHCSNKDDPIPFAEPETIRFQNCRLSEIKTLDVFSSLRFLLMAETEIKTLQWKVGKHLEELDVSKNFITEIPSKFLKHAESLEFANFSNNLIEIIDPLAFKYTHSLEYLYLYGNEITELDPQLFKTLKHLNKLDLSFNKITTLKDHTFDNLKNLEELDLASNPIGNLKIETFKQLVNLKYLNISGANISSIQEGTFFHEHLVSLDLSKNSLKVLDFNIFFYRMKSLKSLNFSDNQLTKINSYENSDFPILTILDIQNNLFSCSYLKNLTKTNFKTISLHTYDYRGPRDPQISHDNGIRCFTKDESTNKSNDHLYIILSATFVCVFILTFSIFCLYKNRDKIFKRNNSVAQNVPSTQGGVCGKHNDLSMDTIWLN